MERMNVKEKEKEKEKKILFIILISKYIYIRNNYKRTIIWLLFAYTHI